MSRALHVAVASDQTLTQKGALSTEDLHALRLSTTIFSVFRQFCFKSLSPSQIPELVFVLVFAISGFQLLIFWEICHRCAVISVGEPVLPVAYLWISSSQAIIRSFS